MAERLFGLETEYGIAGAGAEAGGAERDHLALGLLTRAHDQLPGVPDFYGNGIFLVSGGKFYLDAGHHPEMATPELGNPWDAVRYVLAGERLLERLAATNIGGKRPLLLKTNVDYLSRSSWGTHESFLHSTDPVLLPDHVVPHIVSRVVYCGAGGLDPFSPGIEFVLSPRSLMLERCRSNDSQRNRGIFHEKNEPLSNGNGRNLRLHVIAGESLCSETGMWLRTAATALVVAMIDGGLEPGAGVAFDDPVNALHAVVRDPTCRLRVRAGAREMSALEVQRHLLNLAREHVHADFMPPWAGRACELWHDVLERLERAPEAVSTTLDWSIKRALFERVMARRGFDWDRVSVVTAFVRARDGSREGSVPEAVAEAGVTPEEHAAFLRLRQELFACDARFSQLGGDAIFASLDRAGVLTHHVPGVDNIEHAMENGPACTRARVRAEVIRRVLHKRTSFAAHWEFVLDRDEKNVLDLSDPFESEERWGSAESHRLGLSHPEAPFVREEHNHPFDRRYRAYGRFCDGDYAGAEALLEELIAEEFELPGTYCHLARACLAMDRIADARRHAEAAWASRAQAPRYVLGRTLWFQTLFALMDGGSGMPWLGHLKALGPDERTVNDWTMDPVLQVLRSRVSPETLELMTALARALSGQDGAIAALGELGWDRVEAVEIG